MKLRALALALPCIAIIGGALSLQSRSNATQPSAAYAIAYLATLEPEKDKQKFCLNGATYQGCCSGKKGIDRITDRSVICGDGDRSPSCSQHLNGCCSDNDGIDEVLEDGTVICGNGDASQSCRCDNRE